MELLEFIIREQVNILPIKVYDADFENIADICELHCVSEWEVIGAMLDAIEDMGIDITEYM